MRRSWLINLTEYMILEWFLLIREFKLSEWERELTQNTWKEARDKHFGKSLIDVEWWVGYRCYVTYLGSFETRHNTRPKMPNPWARSKRGEWSCRSRSIHFLRPETWTLRLFASWDTRCAFVWGNMRRIYFHRIPGRFILSATATEPIRKCDL